MEINAFLQDATELNASDVHLTSNHKPTIRLDGELQALGDYDAIDSKALKTLLDGALRAIDGLVSHKWKCIVDRQRHGKTP